MYRITIPKWPKWPNILAGELPLKRALATAGFIILGRLFQIGAMFGSGSDACRFQLLPFGELPRCFARPRKCRHCLKCSGPVPRFPTAHLVNCFAAFFRKSTQGLVNVPFWVYWTSPYSSHYRPYTQWNLMVGWCSMGTFNDPWSLQKWGWFFSQSNSEFAVELPRSSLILKSRYGFGPENVGLIFPMK